MSQQQQQQQKYFTMLHQSIKPNNIGSNNDLENIFSNKKKFKYLTTTF